MGARRRLAACLLVAGAAASAPASAGWSLFGDLERFRWKESTAPAVTETGPMFGLGVEWTAERPAGWDFGYRGRLYFGSVDYEGAELFSGRPLSGTTDYGGMTNEGRALYRMPASPVGAQVVVALGYDYWTRQLTPIQKEDYRVLYLRLGAGFDRRKVGGWYGEGGVKFPLWVDEDAHFPAIGFEPNPHLEPQGEPSLYAELGYHLTARWSLAGYYESYRFGESPDVGVVESGTGTAHRFFQPESSVDMLGLRARYRF